MNMIDASHAKYLTQEFWRENKIRNYKEKIMFAITNAATGGAHQVVWHYGLSRDIKNWLMLLGYTLMVETENNDLKLFKYIISW